MSDKLIDEKIKIAEQGGVLAKQIRFYNLRLQHVEKAKLGYNGKPFGINLEIQEDRAAVRVESRDRGEYTCETTLHDALILYFKTIISDLESELDTLIKVLK